MGRSIHDSKPHSIFFIRASIVHFARWISKHVALSRCVVYPHLAHHWKNNRMCFEKPFDFETKGDVYLRAGKKKTIKSYDAHKLVLPVHS